MKQQELKAWIGNAFSENKIRIESINYIFCSDRYLLKLNRDFLGHNYLTDIITFDNSSGRGAATADIFISKDRVLANAKKFKIDFSEELHRVMIHGALHLIGYSDKSTNDARRMREAEDHWLGKRSF